ELRAGGRAPAAGGGARGPPAGQPAGGLAAPEGAQGVGIGGGPRPGGSSHLSPRSDGGRSNARIPRPDVGVGARRVRHGGRGSGRRTEKGQRAMTQHVDTAVRRHVTVATSQEHAFEVFTNRVGAWWPKEYSISEAGMADFVVEPEAGGRWYEVAKDGREYETGRVLAIDPPERLTLPWHPNRSFQYDPDPAPPRQVEGRFS